jgi:hypothetical protein
MSAVAAPADLDFRCSRDGDRFTLSLTDGFGAGALAEVEIETARLWFDRFEAALGSARLRTRLPAPRPRAPEERTA